MTNIVCAFLALAFALCSSSLPEAVIQLTNEQNARALKHANKFKFPGFDQPSKVPEWFKFAQLRTQLVSLFNWPAFREHLPASSFPEPAWYAGPYGMYVPGTDDMRYHLITIPYQLYLMEWENFRGYFKESPWIKFDNFKEERLVFYVDTDELETSFLNYREFVKRHHPVVYALSVPFDLDAYLGMDDETRGLYVQLGVYSGKLSFSDLSHIALTLRGFDLLGTVSNSFLGYVNAAEITITPSLNLLQFLLRAIQLEDLHYTAIEARRLLSMLGIMSYCSCFEWTSRLLAVYHDERNNITGLLTDERFSSLYYERIGSIDDMGKLCYFLDRLVESKAVNLVQEGLRKISIEVFLPLLITVAGNSPSGSLISHLVIEFNRRHPVKAVLGIQLNRHFASLTENENGTIDYLCELSYNWRYFWVLHALANTDAEYLKANIAKHFDSLREEEQQYATLTEAWYRPLVLRWVLTKIHVNDDFWLTLLRGRYARAVEYGEVEKIKLVLNWDFADGAGLKKLALEVFWKLIPDYHMDKITPFFFDSVVFKASVNDTELFSEYVKFYRWRESDCIKFFKGHPILEEIRSAAMNMRSQQ